MADDTAPRPSIDGEALEFLLTLVDAEGPSGFEQRAGALWRDHAAPFAEVEEDAVGNSFATVNRGAARKVMLAGHLDEIGLIVTKADDKGFLRCTNIGGWDVCVLLGQRLRIMTKAGIVYGSVGRGAIHTLDPDARTKMPKLRDLWIDIGAEDKEEALSRVPIGSPAVIDVTPVRLGEHRVMSRSLDNRVGSFIALAVLHRCQGMDIEVVALGSSREEIGGHGAHSAAFATQPDAAVVIETSSPSDTPGAPVEHDIRVGRGPMITRGASTSEAVTAQLVEAATSADIPIQMRGLGVRTATDADKIVRAGRGVAVGLVAVPTRYLHTPVEQLDLRDVRAAIDLLTAWVALRAGAK